MSSDATAQDRSSYQESLRALGAQLDENNTSSIQVVETSDGFQASSLGDAEDGTRQLRFSYRELAELCEQLRQQKLDTGNMYTIPSPSSYQNILRALGYELDQISAQHVMFEEIRDAFLVSYEDRDHGDQSVWQPCKAIFGPISGLLEDAYARRRTRLVKVSG